MLMEIITGHGDDKHTSHNLSGFHKMLFAITQTLSKISNRCVQNRIAKQIPTSCGSRVVYIFQKQQLNKD